MAAAPGVLAIDALVNAGGKPAKLFADTIARLDEVLRPTWSHGNPVDIIGDGPAGRFADALRALLKDKGCDAILVPNSRGNAAAHHPGRLWHQA